MVGPHPSVAVAAPKAFEITAGAGLHPKGTFGKLPVNVGGATSVTP